MSDPITLEPGSLEVQVSPHIRHTGNTVSKVMWTVVASLLPATLAAVYFFGLRALILIALAIVSAVATEALCQKLMGRPVRIADGSAVITGLLLALMLPVSVPWYIPVLGSVFAIGIAKQAFGGLGMNIYNPALISRTFLLISFPVIMTRWSLPRVWDKAIDGLTCASPLGQYKLLGFDIDKVISMFHFDSRSDMYWHLFTGNISGSIGETSAIALLLGAAVLFFKKAADWRVPLAYFVVYTLSCLVIGQDPAFHILSGGLLLAVLFMATDPVTSPVTKRGRWLFGAFCGILSVLFRVLGGNPEGVSYAILLMNTLTPLIDRYTTGRAFGELKARSAS